ARFRHEVGELGKWSWPPARAGRQDVRADRAARGEPADELLRVVVARVREGLGDGRELDGADRLPRPLAPEFQDLPGAALEVVLQDLAQSGLLRTHVGEGLRNIRVGGDRRDPEPSDEAPDGGALRGERRGLRLPAVRRLLSL